MSKNRRLTNLSKFYKKLTFAKKRQTVQRVTGVRAPRLINRCRASSSRLLILTVLLVYTEIHRTTSITVQVRPLSFTGHELHLGSATACFKLFRTDSKLCRCLFDAFALRPAVRVGLGQNPKPERGGVSVKDSDQMTVCAERPAGQDAPVRPPVGLQASRKGAGGDSPRAALPASS